MRHRLAALLLLTASLSAQTLTPHPIHLNDGKSFTLNLPAGFDISVAAQGLHRIRFMTKSPDGRIFATDMHDLSDNELGVIYIFAGFNPKTGHFASVKTYLMHLRNPNNLAFYTDAAGQSWLYIPLTDKLVRYKYKAGDNAPEGPPETLATYPAYGLSYKYGGWHLTRTVAFGRWNDQDRLFVTAGSSCDACQEKEDIRATLSVMDPDGKNAQILAHGLRNAVAMRFVKDDGTLYATNMGADHLGDADPEDTMFAFTAQSTPANYGWPTCYFSHGTAHADTLISAPKPTDHIFPRPTAPVPAQLDCSKVPAAYTTFAPHSSPLGLEHFGADSVAPLKDSFLIALHGASFIRIGSGYRVVRVSTTAPHTPVDFLTGFLANGKIYGRPCGILRLGPGSFLLTDDLSGVIYYIHAR
jgi:glucose/arabinose dehydrogenase